MKLGFAATVLLSGGQDSTTCLYWALTRFERVDAIGINYGQRHVVEIAAAARIAAAAGATFTSYDFPVLAVLDDSALVSRDRSVRETAKHNNLPASFAPGRNDFFLTLAAAHAYKREREGPLHLVGGMCQTDFSGYPDCRLDFINAKAVALTLALDRRVNIHTPLMFMTKADTVLLAKHLGKDCWQALSLSVTCYEGYVPGCGICPACILRAKGFNEAQQTDPSRVAVLG